MENAYFRKKIQAAMHENTAPRPARGGEHIAIILSGGIGSRMGTDRPKQYIEVQGRPIIAYAIDAFARRNDIGRIVVVVANEWKSYVEAALQHVKQPIAYTSPGATRQLSVFNGLEVCRTQGCADNAIVIIHDAARPLLGADIIDRCIAGIEEGYDGVLPVVRVKDTIYQSEDGKTISRLLNRQQLFAGQAPESFRLKPYYDLHTRISPNELLRINGSSEVAILGGLRVKIVEGSERNFKITTPEDLSHFRQLLESETGDTAMR